MKMHNVYGVPPSIDHYRCMVDILSQGEQIKKDDMFNNVICTRKDREMGSIRRN